MRYTYSGSRLMQKEGCLQLGLAGKVAIITGGSMGIGKVTPGTTRTPRQAVLLGRRARNLGVSIEEAEREAVHHIPIGQMVIPEDKTDLILFLVSERASAITGQVIAVDAGAGRGIVY